MNKAAQALGRLGGLAKSAAKTAAVRENAKKGGWPKGRPRNPKRITRRSNMDAAVGTIAQAVRMAWKGAEITQSVRTVLNLPVPQWA